MEQKINSYVKYIFNLNNIKDEDMYLEITTNLNERYNEYLSKGISEDDAYLKTINTLGEFDFNDPKIDNSFQYKPNWANISLWVSLALGILATILLFISTPVSALFTGLSIALYIGSSYYLYHMSQYALKTEKDINKHNELLKGIFKNLKTTFIFWNINISYWITSTVIGLIFLITSQTILNNPGEIFRIIAGYFVIFAVIFIVILIIFKNIYKNIESKYYELTQQEKLNSYIKETKVFKLNDTSIKVLINISKALLILFYTFIILYEGIYVHFRVGNLTVLKSFSLTYNEFDNKLGSNLLVWLTIITGLFTIISVGLGKKRFSIIGIISLILVHIGSLIYLSLTFLSKKFVATSKYISTINILNILAIIVMIVFLVFTIISFRKEKEKQAL